MRQNVLHLSEVTIRDHAVSLVENEHINHRQSVMQIVVHMIAHKLPKTTRCSNNDSGVVAEQSLLLLNGHASNEGSDFDLVFILRWDHCLDHVLDLDGELTCGTHDEALNAIERELGFSLLRVAITFLLVLVEFVNFADARVQDGHTEAQGLTLSSASGDNQIDARLKVDQTASLDFSWVRETIGFEAVHKGFKYLELLPLLLTHVVVFL